MYYNKINEKVNVDIIRYIWELKIEREEGLDGIYCIPDNCGELLLNIGDDIHVNVLTTTRTFCVKQGDLILLNCRSKGSHLFSMGRLHLISAKLNPPSLRHLSEQAQTTRDGFEQKSNGLTLDSFSGKLHELLAAVTPAPTDDILTTAIEMIVSSKGDIRLKDMYAPLGVSKSTLEHRFLKDLGITPKEFCKIQKMKHFIANYHLYSGRYNLTQLTMMSGYFDQSHFIKDFKYFMDMTPGRFFKQFEQQLELLMAA